MDINWRKLEIVEDREAWRAAMHGVAQLDTISCLNHNNKEKQFWVEQKRRLKLEPQIFLSVFQHNLIPLKWWNTGASLYWS